MLTDIYSCHYFNILGLLLAAFYHFSLLMLLPRPHTHTIKTKIPNSAIPFELIGADYIQIPYAYFSKLQLLRTWQWKQKDQKIEVSLYYMRFCLKKHQLTYISLPRICSLIYAISVESFSYNLIYIMWFKILIVRNKNL